MISLNVDAYCVITAVDGLVILTASSNDESVLKTAISH